MFMLPKKTCMCICSTYTTYVVVLYFLNWKSYYDVLWYIMAKFLIHLYLLLLKIYTILQYLHQPSFHIIFLEKCKFFDRFLANILHILKKYFWIEHVWKLRHQSNVNDDHVKMMNKIYTRLDFLAFFI